MKRKEFHSKYDQIEKYSDRDKELYLRDLENSIYNYIRVGVENKQLEDLDSLEEEFRERYERMFEMNEVMKEVLEVKLSDIVSDYEHKLLSEKEKESVEKGSLYLKIFIREFTDNIRDELEELLMDKWHKIMKDVAYLSHMNMLYNLYEKQKSQQRIERTYEMVTNRFDKMPDIVKGIERDSRMSFTSICKQFNISENELDELLIRENEYFNIRRKGDQVQISLSPSGRNYNRYITLIKEHYSREHMEQLVYKNCDRIVKSLEYSLNKGLELEVTLEGISPDREGVLKYKYHNAVQKMLSNRAETYNRPGYYINNVSREGVYENEEFIYKIR